MLLLSVLYRMARRAGSTPDDTWRYAVHEGKAGQMLGRGWTQAEQEVCLLPSAYERIDQSTGALRLPSSELITNIELLVDDPQGGERRPPSGFKPLRERLTIAEASYWLIFRKLPDGKWLSELETSNHYESAVLELFRAHKERIIEIQGLPDDEPAGGFWLSPSPPPKKITVSAAEITLVYPRLFSAAEWINEAIDRYLTISTAELNALIGFEANRADWARFRTLTWSIGCSTLGDFALEDIARALLASDLDAPVPEIQPTLDEMQEIKGCMVDRLVKADRADRLKAKRLDADHPIDYQVDPPVDVRIKSPESENIPDTAEASDMEAESEDLDEPERNGNPVWNWAGLATHLQSQKPKLTFRTITDALDYYRRNVQRIDGMKPGDGPDVKTVRTANKKFNFHQYVTISRLDSI
jgi:hypothetical protein